MSNLLSYGDKIISGGGSSGSGGHTIVNQSGTALAQESALQFSDAHVSDDSTNEKTVIENIKTVTEAQFESATEDGLYDVDVEGAEIGEISEDYVEVTADGVKTYATLLNELFALIDLSKVDENTTLQFLSGILSVQAVNAKTIYLTQSVFVGGNMEMTTVILTSGASTYKYVRYNGSTFTPTDVGINTPTNGTKITLYYGNDKAVVDLQTTANRCLLSDGRNVQQAVASNNLDNGINISTYTSASPYIFPSDGYITLSISGGTYANGYLKGSASGEIWIDMHEAKQVIHVRKGMKAYFTSGNGTPVAYFIPFS